MKQATREEARRLRSDGMSVRDIAKTLGVSRSSVSLWVRDIELSSKQIERLKANQHQFGAQNAGGRTNRSKHLELRRQYQEGGRARAREMRPLHLVGCMLYWAEGAKGRNGIYFVNSDPNMMLKFVRFLREELKVDNDEMAVRVHCHTEDIEAIQRIESYWTALLSLPMSCIRKTYSKAGSSFRKNRLPNGVCDIRVHRTDLVQHIFGAIQEYGGFENPAWLF